MHVRDATEDDAPACAAIYEPYVRDTAITFELEPPSAAEMMQRIVSAHRTHAWLVAEHESGVIGYAYAGPYQSRPADRWACEVSVYLDRRFQRMGAGRALYEQLFARLEERGFRILVAGMTLPNAGSEGCSGRWVSKRSESGAASGGRTTPGTTLPGPNAPSARSGLHPKNPAEGSDGDWIPSDTAAWRDHGGYRRISRH